MSTTQNLTKSLSPGELFADAFTRDRKGAEVHFDFTITDAFKPTQDRPRLTVRNLFKKRMVEADITRYWQETRPSRDETKGINEAELRQEATYRFGTAEGRVHPVQGWVQIPEELQNDPEALAVFIDYRLLVRLATAENQALTRGPNGLLRYPGVTRLPYANNYLTGVMAACNEIEQNGATAHAMIVNPDDYYHRMMGTGILEDLARNGTLIVRTRMVRPGCALVGDFAVAARLLDAGKSVIRVAEPPPGTFATPGLAVCAEIYEGLAVHLPTLFFHAVPTAPTGD